MGREIIWEKKYLHIMRFMETKKRRPSKHYADELPMYYWIKYNKKRLRQGLLSQKESDLMNELVALDESVRRINQHAYQPTARLPQAAAETENAKPGNDTAARQWRP